MDEDIDDRDREILTFIEGWVPPDLDHWADEQVASAARVLRRCHDATAGSALAEGEEVVCHNDPSPCNYGTPPSPTTLARRSSGTGARWPGSPSTATSWLPWSGSLTSQQQ